MKPDEPNRRPVANSEPVLPVYVQLMSGGRVRLDPAIVPGVAAWLIAASAPWEREANDSERGLKGAERDAFQKRRQYYRHALKVVGELLGGLTGTLPVEAAERAVEEMARALESYGFAAYRALGAVPVQEEQPELGGEG